MDARNRPQQIIDLRVLTATDLGPVHSLCAVRSAASRSSRCRSRHQADRRQASNDATGQEATPPPRHPFLLNRSNGAVGQRDVFSFPVLFCTRSKRQAGYREGHGGVALTKQPTVYIVHVRPQILREGRRARVGELHMELGTRHGRGCRGNRRRHVARAEEQHGKRRNSHKDIPRCQKL